MMIVKTRQCLFLMQKQIAVRQKGVFMETIISSVIAAAVTLLVCIINNSQQAARTRNLLDYKLEQLTKRVDKHNNVIERTYELEKRTDVQEEQIKTVKNRIKDLEEHEHERIKE